MRAIGEKFLEVRGAFGAGQAERGRPLGVQVFNPSQRQARRRERSGSGGGIAYEAFVRPSVGGHLGGLDAETVTEASISRERLDEGAEERVVGVTSVRQEGLVAGHREIEATRLHAYDTFKGADLRQLEVDACIPALIGESAARDAAIEL